MYSSQHSSFKKLFTEDLKETEARMTAAQSQQQFNRLTELHVAFKIAYIYDYITKLCRTQAEVILNIVNPNVCGIGLGEAMHRKYKRLKLGGGQAYDCSAD
jgi:hypothetical protein